MSIRRRLLIVLSAVAIVSAGISAFIGYRSARRALEEQSFERLTAVREMKASQVEDYFRNITDQVLTLSEDRMIIDAAKAFRSAFESLESELSLSRQENDARDLQLRLYYQEAFLSRLRENRDAEAMLSTYWPEDLPSRILQHSYIASNPFEAGSKHLLDDTADGTTYSRAHRLYHPILRSYLERFGYYDIFLVEPDSGYVLYSVFKEVDFGTSLSAGPYRDTNFARAFFAAREAAARDFVRLEDFEPYAPSYDARASFIASPIFDGAEKVGVLVFQMPVDRINDVMTNRREWANVGLGETGETYLVGSDFAIRNQSRFLIEDRENYLRAIERAGTPRRVLDQIASLDSSIGLQEVRTEGTRAALAGETGTRIFPDYRGVPVLSAFRPLEIADVDWVIMSEIDADEAFRPARELRDRVLIGLVLLVIGIVVVAVPFSRSLTQPLKDLSRGAARLAKGEMDVAIDLDAHAHDEIGELSKSFETMRRSLKELLERQSRAIDALSVPLIPLQDEVVVMPLVGELDETRVDRVRSVLTNGLHETGARVAIVDVTGVPKLDETLASGLARAARSARLLGAQVIITGMGPDTARGLADLDIQFEGIVTERSLGRAIDFAMQAVGRKR